VTSCPMHSDITKQMVPFHNSANVPKNQRATLFRLRYSTIIKKRVMLGKTLQHMIRELFFHKNLQKNKLPQ